jgi:hypothetical protein
MDHWLDQADFGVLGERPERHTEQCLAADRPELLRLRPARTEAASGSDNESSNPSHRHFLMISASI